MALQVQSGGLAPQGVLRSSAVRQDLFWRELPLLKSLWLNTRLGAKRTK